MCWKWTFFSLCLGQNTPAEEAHISQSLHPTVTVFQNYRVHRSAERRDFRIPFHPYIYGTRGSGRMRGFSKVLQLLLAKLRGKLFCLSCVFAFSSLWTTLSMILGEGNGTPLQYACLENHMDGGTWQAVVHGVAKCRTRLRDFTFTFHFHALEKEMATCSSVLAWRIPGAGKPRGLPSMGSHRVGNDWSDLAAAASMILI